MSVSVAMWSPLSSLLLLLLLLLFPPLFLLLSGWESLEECNLSLGKVSGRFLHRAHQLLSPKLVSLAGYLSTQRQNVQAYYSLLCLLTMELGATGVGEVMLVLEQVQAVAVTEGILPSCLRVALHCTVAGVLHLISLITDNSSLKIYVQEVLASRREHFPHLLPDSFQWTDSTGDGELAELSPEVLFQLREKGFVQSVSLQRNSSELHHHEPPSSSWCPQLLQACSRSITSLTP